MDHFNYDIIFSQVVEVMPKRISVTTPVSFDAFKRGMYRSQKRYKELMEPLGINTEGVLKFFHHGHSDTEGATYHVWLDTTQAKFKVTIIE